MRRSVLSALALAVAALPAAADVAGELARLRSPLTAERAAAERWLAAHLGPGDLAAVAEAALAGEFEVRARLTNAIGSDDRHFDLAVLLACEREPALRHVGGAAFAAMAARWFGATELAPIDSDTLRKRLAGLYAAAYRAPWRPGELAADLERLARARPEIEGGLERKDSIGLALDPSLALESEARAGPTRADAAWLEGSFDALLFDVARAHGVELEGFGFGGRHPFVRAVHPADSGRPDLGGKNGVELALRWCRDVVEYGDRPRGAAASRALAGTAWSGAIAWLEGRWQRLGDRAALAGVLLAAGRGQVSPGLANARAVESLVTEADAALASGSREGARFARDVASAMARVPPLSPDGRDDLTLVALRGFESASAAGRRLRAAVVAGMGRAPEEWRAERTAELARAPSSLDAATALAYLRALSETERAEPAAFEIAAPAPLLELAEALRAGPELVTWARASGARPPGAWRDPRALPADLGLEARATAIDWWMAIDAGAAAAHVRAWIASGRPLATLGDRCADRAARGDLARVDGVLRALRADADEPTTAALDRIEAFAGRLSAERARARLAELTGAPVSDSDLPCLGALVGRVATDLAVDQLIDAVAPRIESARTEGAQPSAAWAEAAGRAYRGLLAQGAPETRLLRALRSALRGGDHAVARAFRAGTWPPPPAGPPISLAATEFGP